jgi:Cdc6-like AAA superfamily ATPase
MHLEGHVLHSFSLGNPGTGKNVLAASVVQGLMTSAAASQPPLPLMTFFFFEYNAIDRRPAPPDYAYRAILSLKR